MTIVAGSRLGPYEIVAPIGAGGMGEVYKARDTRLDRTVAIKVLPSHLCSNPQLRERFDREARTISSLTHPHICALYDVGHQDGIDYLVMEYLEGESLADRLAKGPLPIDQVLRYGIEISDALDKAHRQGIVHRDLKPGNIMLTKSGGKLLDFGLAKYSQPPDNPLVQLTSFPTEHRPLTQEGTILGTFQYMAPEQLEGAEADARTDIFSFGAVLYEMATGKRAFQGKNKTSLIAAIVDRDPAPMSSIQPMTPPAFERVVKTCLAKDPDDRWQTAHDVMLELKWIGEAGSQAGVPAIKVLRRKNREMLAWIVATLAVLAAAVTFVFRPWPAEACRVELSVTSPAKADLSFDNGSMALSPDGKRLAFIASTAGKSEIWIRSLSAGSAQPLAGTEGAVYPFWSPDSKFLGFFAGAKLKKIDVTGGPPQTVCDASVSPRGGTWNRDGVILFAPSARDPIQRVSAAGGSSQPVTKIDTTGSEFSHRWPSFLPDGKHFLYLVQTYGTGAERNRIVVGSLDSPDKHPIVNANSPALYAPQGYLLFARESTLLAQKFDPKSFKSLGDAFPIADQVETYPSTGSAIFSVSDEGTLAFHTGSGGGISQLTWLDRSGKPLGTAGPPGDYSHPRLSHDGRRVALETLDPQPATTDIWVMELTRGTSSRFTFEPTDEVVPTWSPDDSRIAYSYQKPDRMLRSINIKASSGASAPEVLSEHLGLVVATDWSRDGRFILGQSIDPKTKTGWDLWVVSIADRTWKPFLQTRFNELAAQISTDGHWIAYSSDESGRPEVYVQPFPGPGGKWQISTSGGGSPRWRGDGRELFYKNPEGKVFAVDVKTGTGFEASMPALLFSARFKSSGGPQWDVSADGKRFLINQPVADVTPAPMTIVLNWTAGLKK